MKNIVLLIIVLILFTIQLFSQCNPDAGINDSICGNNYVLNASLGNINSVGTWTSNCPVASFTNINDSNTNVNCLSGVWEFYWTENDTITPCTLTDTVTVSFWDAETAIHLVDDSTWCGLSFPNLNAITPVYGNGFWIDEISGTEFYNTLVSNPDSAVVVDYGMHYFHWVIHNGACKDTTVSIPVRFVEMPVAEAGLSIDTACGFGYNLNAIPSVGIGMWHYFGPGSITNTPNNYLPNPYIVVDTWGDYSFIWAEDNTSGCIDKDTIVVVFADCVNIIDRNKINENYTFVYPNPTTGKIDIETKEVKRIDILDITGKNLQGFKNENLIEIDLGQYPKGIYIIKITTSNGVVVEKVILE